MADLPHTDAEDYSFGKEQRLCSRALVSELFSEGKSVSSFPVRVVYHLYPLDRLAGTQVLFSVPKKRFKRAVKRNRVKRQFRDMYRHTGKSITDALCGSAGLTVAFIFCDERLWTSDLLMQHFVRAEQKLLERLAVELPSFVQSATQGIAHNSDE